jgi:sterol 24-C-methyltransferase
MSQRKGVVREDVAAAVKQTVDSDITSDKAVPSGFDLMQNTKYGKGEVKQVVDNYVDFFDKSKGFGEDERKEHYETVVNSYYDLATDFYEYGWGQSFHFATQAKDEPYAQAIARHEHFLALKLKLNKGERVLDCGCGVGGSVREIARFSGVQVIGINNNEYQVSRARKHTATQGLGHLVSFVKGNFMAIPFEESSFDSVYAIEATCHAPNKQGIYSEIFRVLKPGRCFSGYEWCMTDKYDPSNEQHRAIKLGIEEGDGIPDLATTRHVIEVLREVGFEVLEASDLAHESEIPWYSPLSGNFNLTNLKATRVGRWFTHKLVNILEFVGLVPKGTVKTHDFLIKVSDLLCEGGRLDIFTPMFFFVARKPE